MGEVQTIVDLIMLAYDEGNLSTERLAELEAALRWVAEKSEEA